MTDEKKTINDKDKTVIQEVENESVEADLNLIFGWLIDCESDQIYRIKSEKVRLGSDPSSDIIVKDVEVEKLHCFIYYDDGRFEINDNNTHGRTKLNGKAVRREFIEDGAKIMIGNKLFLWRCFRSRL